MIANPHPINLIHANPDMLINQRHRVLSSLGDRYFQDKYNIGYWVWESQHYFPTQWLQTFKLFHEIWTPSNYSNQAISNVSPIPVMTIPHAISLPEDPAVDRQELGLPADKFVFLFIYDPLSLSARKNPEGVIKAFQQAFDRSDDRVCLVIKTKGINAQTLAKFKQLAADCAQIILIDAKFSRDRLNALIYHCDCYLSLHRCEGFGLTLAEAMFYGKPTIATGFSGNLDFMNRANSFLVDYQPIELDRDIVYFGKGTIWAEPDLDCASRYMQQVVADPALANQIGTRAARDIRSQLSPQAVGAKIQARMQAIAANF
jgi:glycosyltransferase involved in cell wall biosynthesis